MSRPLALPVVLAIVVASGCRSVSLCECDCPVLADTEDEALPPLSERKIERVERLKEMAPIKGAQAWRSPGDAVASRGPSASDAAVAQAPFQVFFGNLHSHTSYSDGSGTRAASTSS